MFHFYTEHILIIISTVNFVEKALRLNIKGKRTTYYVIKLFFHCGYNQLMQNLEIDKQMSGIAECAKDTSLNENRSINQEPSKGYRASIQ